MAETETLEHPFWGRICRHLGEHEWHCDMKEELPNGTPVVFRYYFDDPNDEIVHSNHRHFRERWAGLWPRILSRIQKMKTDYGYKDVPIRADDWFYITIPKHPIDDDTEWSVMLQAEEAGWLLDFKGWENFGGQGVF